jgi:hypothetical protein
MTEQTQTPERPRLKRFLSFDKLDKRSCVSVLAPLRYLIKNPRHEWLGIEAFSLKAYRMRENKSHAPPVLHPKGLGIKPTVRALSRFM